MKNHPVFYLVHVYKKKSKKLIFQGYTLLKDIFIYYLCKKGDIIYLLI
jgi:hypothetical protein